MIYVIVTLLIWFAGGLFKFDSRLGNRERRKRQFLIVACYVMFLLQALRGKSVGSDTVTYLQRFTDVRLISWTEILSFHWYVHGFEFGFVILEKIIYLFTNNAQWLLVVCAAIYVRCIYKFILEESNDYFLTMTVAMGTAMFLEPMNLMRQGVAAGICLLGWIQWQQNKKLNACGLVLLAMSFHFSAIVFFFVYLIKYVPTKKWIMIAFSVVFVALVLFGDRLIRVALSYFPIYFGRYGHGRWTISNARGIIILWAIIAAIIIKCLFTFDWENEKNHKKFEVLLLSVIYLCICAVGRHFDGFDRLTLYFVPFLVLLFEEGAVFEHRELRSLYRFGVEVCMTLLWLRNTTSVQYFYSFFWQ